jgi:hypothetical protein
MITEARGKQGDVLFASCCPHGFGNDVIEDLDEL